MTNVIIFPRRHYMQRRREFAIDAVAAAMCGIFGWAFVAYVIVDCATHLVRGVH